MKELTFVLVIFILTGVGSFEFRDCTYDVTTYHVEYICGVDLGENFSQKTREILYCKNYTSGIHRRNIQILSIQNCDRTQLYERFLDVFQGLRVLNISFTGIVDLFETDIKYNKYLEEIIASHNRLSEIPVDLFIHTSELISLDFSNNRIHRIDSFVFDNVRK